MALVELFLLTVGINFMFLAIIYSIMIKYPSRYMRERCMEYGYELYGSAVGKVNTTNDVRQLRHHMNHFSRVLRVSQL